MSPEPPSRARTLRPAPGVERVRAYVPPRHRAPADLRLGGNEGASPDPVLWESLREPDLELLRCYPTKAPLERALADRYSLDPEQVLVTAGADEALDRAFRALLAPGREVVLPVPTFEMIDRYAILAGAAVREVEWLRGAFPVEAVIAACSEHTAAAMVVSPNNPTGLTATARDLRRLREALPGVALLVDLAYAEYADEDLTETALALPDTLVFRTLSKARGLAGLRVGCVLGPAEVIGWLRRAGGPFPVAGLALRVAETAVAAGDSAYEPAVAVARDEREQLARRLASLGAEVWPSQANFVLARFENATWVRDALAGLGIDVRSFPDRPLLDGCLRVACPCDEDALARVLAGFGAALAPAALLFDLDGVVADVSRSFRTAILATAADFGVTLAAEDVDAAKAAGGANCDWALTHRLLGERGVERSFEEVKARFEEHYQGSAGRAGTREEETLLFDRDVLVRLAARLPLAIVTGRPRADAQRFLDRFELTPLFSAVVAREDGPLKPDPAPVRAALAALDVSRAWMIGDTPDDCSAARAAGVVPLAVDSTHEATRDALWASGAARLLASAADLETLL